MGINVRCIQCSNAARFRNYRGAQLKNWSCECGGSFERLKEKSVEGVHPVDESQTRTWSGKSFHFEFFSKHGRFVLDESKNKYSVLETFELAKKIRKHRSIDKSSLSRTGLIPLSRYVDGATKWIDHDCEAGDRIEWKRNGTRGSVKAVIIGWLFQKPGFIYVENWKSDWSAPADQKSKVWIKIRSVLRIIKYVA